MLKVKRAFIIGNGPSRKGFDLKLLKGHGTIFGCNALYRDYPKFDVPDYLVAIDDAIVEEIQESKFPKDRFILPPEDERNEDSEYNPYVRLRSNAGVNAMLEAIKKGHRELYCLGFDFMLKNPRDSLGNIYEGTNAYGPETKSRYVDNMNRVKYMTFIANKYSHVDFKFVVPRFGNKDEYHNLNANNVFGVFYDKFNTLLHTELTKVATR
jgi:hypothetical protein